MLLKLLLYVLWTAAIGASSRLDHLGQPVATTTSSQPILARPGISTRTIGLQEPTGNDTQTCDPNKMSWYNVVIVYSEQNRQSLNKSLIGTLGESEMTLTGNLSLASDPYDPYRVFCDIFPKDYDRSGTSFPRCLLETAIDDFCTVSVDTPVDENVPSSTHSKGGRWKTYKFTGYSISGLYVALEISKEPECREHKRFLYPKNNTPDLRCKDKLLGEIVDRCQTNSNDIKFGGALMDSCETWAVYPLPPFKNATGGQTSVLSAATSGSTAYSLCGTTALLGVFPATAESWSTPTAVSQATLSPVSIKTDFGSADSTTTTATTGTPGTPGTTGTTGTSGTKGATGGTKKIKRSNFLTAPIARETNLVVSSVPAGPGRRQLFGV